MNIKEYIAKQAKNCDSILQRYLQHTDSNTKLFEAIKYSANTGGKRLRMILMQEAARAVGDADTDIFAAALEMIHTYSLIHDDLPAMDNSDTRRGQPSCHKKYNECLAILAGDGLFHLAFEIMTDRAIQSPHETKYIHAVNIIAKKCGLFGMVYGQALDTENPKPSPDLKEKIDQNKTAAMFEAAVMTGVVLAGREDLAGEFERFGRHFGLAYQIVDDIKDGDTPPERICEANRHIKSAKKILAPYDKNGFFEGICDLLTQ